MRRLRKFAAAAALAAALVSSGCKRRERIQLETTDESLTLASTVHTADPNAAPQLIRGFHAIEQNSWRWTMSNFSVVLKAPAGASRNGATLIANISIPQAVIDRVGQTRLTASIGGSQVGWASYNTAGEFRFTADIPAIVIGDEAVRIDFALDRFLGAGAIDSRELGLIVSSISLEPK